MTILSAADFPEVRASIDISLTPKDLPDAIIAMGVYQGAAEDEVFRKLPDLGGQFPGSLTPENQRHVRSAAVLLTAALLVPTIPKLTVEIQQAEYQYSRQHIDWQLLVRDLKGRAYSAIQTVVDSTKTSTAGIPTMFTRAIGSRGRSV